MSLSDQQLDRLLRGLRRMEVLDEDARRKLRAHDDELVREAEAWAHDYANGWFFTVVVMTGVLAMEPSMYHGDVFRWILIGAFAAAVAQIPVRHVLFVQFFRWKIDKLRRTNRYRFPPAPPPGQPRSD